MTCSDCGSDEYPPSPIEGVCVVCATRDWRICRTKLTEFRRDIEGEIEDPSPKLITFLDSARGINRSAGINIGGESNTIEYRDGYRVGDYNIETDFERTAKSGGAGGFRGLTKQDLPEEILDLFFAAGYDVWEEESALGESLFYKKKDKELTQGCRFFFSPEFMYQMYCESCWSIIKQKRTEKAKETEDSGSDTYSRFCAVCESYFETDRPSHYLCGDCEHEWLSCSGRGCGAYFRPYEGRFSESYCPECRKTVPATNVDLLIRIGGQFDLELNFNQERKFRDS